MTDPAAFPDPDDADETPPRFDGTDVLFLLVLVGVVGGGGADLLLDSRSRVPVLHLAAEGILILASLAGIVVLVGRWRAARQTLVSVERDLAVSAAERDAWRARAEYALTGLSREVDAQFETWGLTAAEREVAVRLVKGHSVRRIARETDRSEKTVRQHAVAVYRKSGLSGRAELAGFFLGGLSAGGPPPA